MIDSTDNNNKSQAGQPEASAEGRPLEDLVLDAFVYGPLGLAQTVITDYSSLVARGRGTVSQQLSSARIVGHIALGQSEGRIDRHLSQIRKFVEDVARPLIGDRVPWVSDPSMAGSSETAASSDAKIQSSSQLSHETSNSTTSPSAATLAIPDYDALSASQVVQRLSGVTRAELEDIVSYESVTRNRRTVLGKANQLLNSGPG